MPMYNYHCENCNRTFEKYIPYTEINTKVVFCPKCRKASKRKLTPSPVIYRGKGFYTTDKKKV